MKNGPIDIFSSSSKIYDSNEVIEKSNNFFDSLSIFLQITNGFGHCFGGFLPAAEEGKELVYQVRFTILLSTRNLFFYILLNQSPVFVLNSRIFLGDGRLFSRRHWLHELDRLAEVMLWKIQELSLCHHSGHFQVLKNPQLLESQIFKYGVLICRKGLWHTPKVVHILYDFKYYTQAKKCLKFNPSIHRCWTNHFGPFDAVPFLFTGSIFIKSKS